MSCARGIEMARGIPCTSECQRDEDAMAHSTRFLIQPCSIYTFEQTSTTFSVGCFDGM